MLDQENTATVQLAFELGRITRHAMHRCIACDHQVELSNIAEQLLELGQDKIAPDVLMMFVAAFHETAPTPERRSDQRPELESM